MDISLYSSKLISGTTFRIRGSVNGVLTIVDADLGTVTPTDQQALDALERGTVRNASGGTFTEGTLVYISGWNETELKAVISKADANVQGAAARYVLREAIGAAANGYAFFTHRLTGVDTDGATVGDPVYLSETAGEWTLTAPTAAGSLVQIVGRVAVVDATAGEIEFDLNNPTVAIGGRQVQAGVLKVALIAGGAAGAHTVTGIASGDEIVSVIHNTAGTLADLTAEFTVTGADTIDNPSGTDTTGDQLLVLYIDKT